MIYTQSRFDSEFWEICRVVDLLQAAQLPPFLAERLEKEYTIHDFTDPADPDVFIDEVGPKIAASSRARKAQTLI